MKLFCNVNLSSLSDKEKSCGSCEVCQPKSALNYPFERDLKNSLDFTNELKILISVSTPYKCVDTEIYKNPDLSVLNHHDELVARIEAKFLEGKAFMKVAQLLSDSLYPKEVLVVDEPKLISYFECKKHDKEKLGKDIPIFIVWKFDRPCIDVGGITIFQEIDALKKIYEEKGNSRKFRRKATFSDYRSGRRMGIIDKFHFSITECQPIGELSNLINSL